MAKTANRFAWCLAVVIALLTLVLMAPRPARADVVDDEYRELVIRWAPIDGTPQEAYFDDDTQDGYILFSGGWGAGKTMSLTAKVLKLSAINAPLPGIWCVPDYNHIQDTIIPTLTELDPDTVKAGDGQPWFLRPDQFKYYAHPGSERPGHCLVWDGGGPIWFVTAENADSIAGPNVAWCATDEPGSIKQAAWRNTVARVRHPLATLRQKVAAGTAEGLNYLSDLFGPDRPDNYRLYTMATRDNRELLRHNPQYLEQVMANATEAELAAYLEGKFVPMSGALAYSTFNPDAQTIQRVLDERLPLRITFDFNVDPMTCVIGQQHPGPQGTEYIAFEAIALRDSTVMSMCAEILKRHPRWRMGAVIYGDATGKSRSVKSLKSNYDLIKEALAEMGPLVMNVPLENPPVTRRINSVNRLCRDGRGVTRFYVVGDPMKPRLSPTRELVRSLQATVKKPGTDDIWKKPGETVSHMSDALGYWLDKEDPAIKPDAGIAIIRASQAPSASQTMQAIRAAKHLRRKKELGLA
jgi:hypothetical protein